MPRRWWLAPMVMLIVVAAAAGYTLKQPPVYRASMMILVGEGNGLFEPDKAAAIEPFTQTLSELVKSDIVASGVVERLQLEIEPSAVLDRVQVTTRPEMAVLEVSYDDTDRVRGRRVLAAVGDVFTQLVNSRTAAQAQAGKLAVSATVFDPAHYVPGLVGPTPTLTLGVAAALGLVLGILAVLAQAQLDRLRPATVRPLRATER